MKWTVAHPYAHRALQISVPASPALAKRFSVFPTVWEVRGHKMMKEIFIYPLAIVHTTWLDAYQEATP